MIDHGDWMEDPLSDQHEPPGSDGLTGDPYGPVWHDGSTEPGPVDHDHLDSWPADPVGAPGGTGQAAGVGPGLDSGLDSGLGHSTQGAYGAGGADVGAGPDHAGSEPISEPISDPLHPASGADLASPAGVAVPVSEFGVDPYGFAPEASSFPTRLDLDVSPSDGPDWVDVDLLGDPGVGSGAGPGFASPDDLLADLHRLDGGAGAPSWSAVAGSDDPAVRALGLHWRQG
ncbi:MAG TPA: hypothetical protein VFX70_13185 [Mycobacteriales bacterium]|nr:hypothetical protein [Mycobacteriales bacterium]